MSIKRTINRTRKKLPLTTLQKIFFGLLIVIGALTGLFIAQVHISFTKLKDIKPLESYTGYAMPTRVYDIHGALITEFFKEKREIVAYADLPPYLVQALIATEDRVFYSHHGFNPWAMFKGVFIDPLLGKGVRGGSTITQQLAKGLFTQSEKTALRKFIELWYAFQIEKKYSKEEILELYFNQFEFGHGTHGIEIASNFYFNKHAKDLNLAEASLLVGLVNAPNRFSPIKHPYRAQSRHKVVLNSMVAMGYVTEAMANEAFEDFWGNYAETFKNKSVSANRTVDNDAPYFTEYIRGILIEKYGEELLYNGGLQIYTTLDLEKQRAGRSVIKEYVQNEQENYDKEFRKYQKIFQSSNEDIVDMLSLVLGLDNIPIGPQKTKKNIEDLTREYDDILYLSSFLMGLDDVNEKVFETRYNLKNLASRKKNEVEGALITLNPKNGYIEAMVGGKDFTYANQFNRAVLAKRQMGSSFKAIYYGIALDNRLITAGTVFKDAPLIYYNEAGSEWTPRNYSGTFEGDLRVRQALQKSVNVISVQVWDILRRRLGYTRMSQTLAKYFGLPLKEMQKRVQPQMAFSLGVGIFSPLEVAQAFGVYANKGKTVRALGILKVMDRFGKVLNDFEFEKEMNKEVDDQVVSPQTAFIMSDILKSVLYHGTGAGAISKYGFYYPAGGKTGTTSNWKDAWFAGITENMVTVLWIGFDDASKSLGRHRSAATIAAPAWVKYMKQACAIDPPGNFYNPGGIIQKEICAKTGLLPTPYTPNTVLEYFLPGTLPKTLSPVSNDNDISEIIYHKKDLDMIHDNMNIDSGMDGDPFEDIDTSDSDLSGSDSLNLNTDLDLGID